jgi:hypothetical protein
MDYSKSQAELTRGQPLCVNDTFWFAEYETAAGVGNDLGSVDNQALPEVTKLPTCTNKDHTSCQLTGHEIIGTYGHTATSSNNFERNALLADIGR